MIKINVFVTKITWKKYIKNPENYLKKKLLLLNKKNSFFSKKNIEFSIRLESGLEIKKLNKAFRNKNTATDIISFPFYKKNILQKLIKKKEKIYLGDIIINLDKIIKNSKKLSFKKYFDKIWIHGLVHLLGGRHKLKKDFLKMNKLEIKFFNSIN